MFTGIVQGKAVIQAIDDKYADQQLQFRQLTVQFPPDALASLQRGASIAINGTCLTATEFSQDKSWCRFDVIDETLRLTNLGDLQTGQQVNFERSLKFGDEIGGHLVSGHIHGMGTIRQRIETTDNVALEISAAAEMISKIWPKGFIAVDGASLTVGEVTDDSFWLHLIPETLALTCFGEREVGAKVNLEVDQQAAQAHQSLLANLHAEIRAAVRAEIQIELAKISSGL